MPVPRVITSVRVRITSNGWAAVVGASVMFAMAVQTQSVWMQVVGSALVGLLGISWLSLVALHGHVTVGVERLPRAAVGEQFDVKVSVRNKERLTSLPVRITSGVASEPSLFAPIVVYVDPILGGEQMVITVPRVATRRGAALLSTLTVAVIGPFGFFIKTVTGTHEAGFFAAPSPVRPLDLPALTGAELDGLGPMGPGLDVRGVREWRPGDAVRHVHWRSTARTGRLAVLEYGEPTVGTVGVLAAGTPGEPIFEAGVALMASTAMQTLSTGVVVVIPTVDRAGQTHQVQLLTLEAWHRAFAEMGLVAVPRPETVARMVDRVGAGGLVLVALGSGVPGEFRSHVESVASAAGVRILYVSDHLQGRS
jgi:uncharacterized protein (DUF58 family)